jgi:hypothetical protein
LFSLLREVERLRLARASRDPSIIRSNRLPRVSPAVKQRVAELLARVDQRLAEEEQARRQPRRGSPKKDDDEDE